MTIVQLFDAKRPKPRLVVREVESGLALGCMNVGSPLTTVGDSFAYLFEEHERAKAQAIADGWPTKARVVEWDHRGTTEGGAR